MKQKLKDSKKRLCAIWMVLLMLVSMIPNPGIIRAEDSSSAQAPKYIVKVSSGGNGVENALVKYSVIKKIWVPNATESGGGHNDETTIIDNAEAHTDKNGNADLTALKSQIDDSGSYILQGSVVKAGFYNQVIGETQIGTTGVKIEVPLNKAFTVKVVRQDTQKSIKNAKVSCSLYTLDANNNKSYVSGKNKMTAETDEDGIATLQELKSEDLATGVYVELKAESEPEYETKLMENISFSDQSASIAMERKVVDFSIEGENFTATVDGESVPAYIKKAGNTTLSVAPQSGYVITSIIINNVEQIDEQGKNVGVQSYVKTLKETQKTGPIAVMVGVEKAYRITVEYDSNKGSVTTNVPNNALDTEGKVFVIKKNGGLQVTATPKEGYRLTSVMQNGVEKVDSEDAKNNDNAWNKHSIVDITKDTTLIFEFKPNIYQVSVTTKNADKDCSWYFNEHEAENDVYFGDYGTKQILHFKKSTALMVEEVQVDGGVVAPNQDADAQDMNVFTIDIELKKMLRC